VGVDNPAITQSINLINYNYTSYDFHTPPPLDDGDPKDSAI